MAELTSGLIEDGELLRKLEQIEDRIQKSILQEAFEAAAKDIESAVEVAVMAMVQRRTGNLESSIGHRTKKYRGTVFTTVGPQWPKGAHGHLVEFGHEIVVGGSRSGTGKTARVTTRANQRGKGRSVGRTRAFPFEERAWDSVKYIALATIEQKITAGIASVIG